MIRHLFAALLVAPLLVLSAHAAVGSLDPSFGNAGVVPLSTGYVRGDLGPDGRIAVARRDSFNTFGNVLVQRLNADGSSDTSFGNLGSVTLAPCAGCAFHAPDAVAVQADGRVLVAITESLQGSSLYPAQGLVVRLNVDGSLDGSFGAGGRTVLQFGADTRIETLVAQPDGRILVGGSTGPLTPPGAASTQQRMVARLDASGNPDPGFDADGVVLGALGRVMHLNVRPDGSIVALGTSDQGAALTRYSATGTQEVSTLLAPGYPAFSWVEDAAWEPDGRIWMYIYDTLSRRMPDGTPDPTFTPIRISRSQRLARLADGSVLAHGDRFVRILASGAIDPDFGNHGELRTVAIYRTDRLITQPDGKVLAIADNAIGRVQPMAAGFVGTHLHQFPYQSLGTLSEAWPVTVTNTTGAPLAISVDAPAPFEHRHECGATLAAGAACEVFIYFRPRPPISSYYNQEASATLSITSGGGPAASIVVLGYAENGLVYHFYRSILRREPDANGADYWSWQGLELGAAIGTWSGSPVPLRTSHPWYALAMTFFGSPEYRSFAPDDDAYLADLYRTFFDREPDTAGVAYWKDQLSQGLTREGLLLQFMFSPEFTAFTETNFNENETRAEIATVIDFYRGLLHRLPDAVGFNHWLFHFQRAQCAGAANLYAQVESISKQFAESAEYLSLARDNAGYVVDLYNAFLGRAPDLAGLQFWKGRLDANAMSRDAMRQAFMASPEFSARVQAMVSEACRP